MDLLTPLVIMTLPTNIDTPVLSVSAYCQNLYWQPNAYERMLEESCDIEQVAQEINQVKSGRYE